MGKPFALVATFFGFALALAISETAHAFPVVKKPAQKISLERKPAPLANPSTPITAGSQSFKNFQGPKPGEWRLNAMVFVTATKQQMNQTTNACVKPGEDLKQRALGQMGDASQGCVISITKDTLTQGTMTTKCKSISATVDMLRVSDSEYRYNVDSTMAKVITTGTFVSATCSKITAAAGPVGKKSNCESCADAVATMKAQCAALSDVSREACRKSVTAMSSQCAAQCEPPTSVGAKNPK